MGFCLLIVLLLPACGKRSLSQENDQLRAERLAMHNEIAALQQKVALREGELRATREQLGERVEPIDGVQPPRLAGIVLGLYTGPIDLDGDAVYDELRIYMRPVDQHGRQITAEGTAKVTLVSPPSADKPAGTLLLEKTYGPEALHTAYRSGVTGTHYTLAADLPAERPTHATLHVALTDAATGRTYTAQKPVVLVRGAE